MWQERTGYKAFALSRNGLSCSSSWNAADRQAAEKTALESCDPKENCAIYASSDPIEFLKRRQEHLAALGLYSGKIDGIWGGGTRAAMARLLDLADAKDADEATGYELLNWAARIKKEYDIDPELAASFAQRAMNEKSYAFVKAELTNRGTGGEDGEVASLEADDEPASEPASGLEKPLPPERSIAWKFGPSLRQIEGWPAKEGAWVASPAVNADEHSPKIGRCRLFSQGVIFLFSREAEDGKGVILLADDLDVPAGAKQAVWTLNNGWSLRQDLGRDGVHGTYVKVSDPARFFSGLADEKLVRLKVAGGNRERRIAVGLLKKEAARFLDCIEKVKSEPAIAAKPAQANEAAKAGGEFTLYRDPRGHFNTIVMMNGTPVAMMVDTGASLVSVSEKTALSIGINIEPSDYRYDTNTANGVTKFAKAVADEIRLGSIVYTDVPIAVMKDGALTTGGLLGMSFLNRLKRFEFGDGKLRLAQ